MISPKTKKVTLKRSSSAAMMIQPKCLVVNNLYFQCSFYWYTHFIETSIVAPLVYSGLTRRLFSDIFSGAKMNVFFSLVCTIETYTQEVYNLKVSDFLNAYCMRYKAKHFFLTQISSRLISSRNHLTDLLCYVYKLWLHVTTRQKELV
jgi:hypothetical protein